MSKPIVNGDTASEYRHLEYLFNACDALIDYSFTDVAVLYRIKERLLEELKAKRDEIRQFDPSFERGVE